MRPMVVCLMVLALGGCKKKAPLVKTPVRQLAPLEGTAPVAPELAKADEVPSTPPTGAPPPSDAKVPAAPVPAAKPVVPSVANPYTWGKERLPLYKQRAKFF
jgi:hypothetical protein